jgi:hypothetical protein
MTRAEVGGAQCVSRDPFARLARDSSVKSFIAASSKYSNSRPHILLCENHFLESVSRSCLSDAPTNPQKLACSASNRSVCAFFPPALNHIEFLVNRPPPLLVT